MRGRRTIDSVRPYRILRWSRNTNHGGLCLIFARVTNFCWFCFKWGLALGAVAVVVGLFYLDDRVDREIRRCVRQRIAQHYADLDVTVRSAALVEGKGIEVRGLSILHRGAVGPGAELVYVDELFLQCPTDLQELISGEPRVTHITVRRPKLRVTRGPGGKWSTDKLFPLPKFSQHPPSITIEGGMVEIFDPLKRPASTLSVRDVNLTLSAPDPSLAIPGARHLQGTFRADHLRKVEVEGLVESESQTGAVSGSIDTLEVSPEMRDSLPEPLAAKLAVLGQLRGQATFRFRVACDASLQAPCRYELSGRLVQGRMDDPRLPYPLTDMTVPFRLDNAGFAINEMIAQSGQASVRVSARQSGLRFGIDPLQLDVEARELDLSSSLRDRLPERLRREWRKYEPAGRLAHVKVSLTFDGRTWRPDIRAECSHVSFSHERFRYRLEHGSGHVHWRGGDDSLEVRLTAFGGSQRVSVNAKAWQLSAAPTFWFQAKGDGLQMDPKLFDALEEKHRTVVDFLHPTGTVNFCLTVQRDQPHGPTHRDLELSLNRCSMWYEKFPYPLGNLCGKIEMHDDRWTFHDLQASNDTGRVSCSGTMMPFSSGEGLYLKLAATDVPLDEELRDAMPPGFQRVWSGLQPHGKVDLNEVEIRYVPAWEDRPKKFSLKIHASPNRDTTWIEPVAFPYRMEWLGGALVYCDGHVTLQDIEAKHGSVRLSTGGHSDFLPDGRWTLHLSELDVQRLRPDERALREALPGRLKKLVEQLQPVGHMRLDGKLNMEGDATAGNPVRFDWDLNVGFFQGSIDCGVMLEHLCGEMSLRGRFDGRRVTSAGELNVESLTYKDYQFTQVRGPLWLDDERVLLGRYVARQPPDGRAKRAAVPAEPPPPPLTAMLLGGMVSADAWVTLGAEPRYGLRAELPHGDLSRFAQEAIPGRQDLRGKIEATVELGGAGRTINGLVGRGTIRLREADIYELPLIVALLKILSIREPDRTAFRRSDIAFRIEGPHLYFQQVNFRGDAISLLGQGQMGLQPEDSDIDLTFHAIVGRGDLNLPLIKEVFTGASQQIMQIRVTGTLQDPVTRKVAFPAVNQALQQIQQDLNKAANPQGLFPQARQRMPDPRRGSRRTN